MKKMTDLEKEVSYDLANKYYRGGKDLVEVAQAALLIVPPSEMGRISDGYHTFNELYEHRHTLWIALCRAYSYHIDTGGVVNIFRSKVHSDGSSWDDWFVLGMYNIETGTCYISYHLPMSKWAETEDMMTLDRVPGYDGHTSNDVLDRLKTLGRQS